MSQPALAGSATAPFLRRAFDWWIAQVKHALPPTIFFFVGFNLILWTKRLILEEHGVEFSGFLTATLAALLVGKAVLVTDNLPFMRRFDGAPMIQPILFKSSIYWLCVFMVRLAERLVHFLAAGGVIADFPTHLVEHFSWPRFLSIQVWLMVLFLVYVTTHELNMLIGDGELYRLFFRWRSSEAKLTRRQRIRLLTRLNRPRPSANGARARMLNWSTSYTSSLRRPSYRRHVLDGLRATPQIRCSLLLVWIILSTSEVALDVPASTLQRADEMRSLLKRMSGLFTNACQFTVQRRCPSRS